MLATHTFKWFVMLEQQLQWLRSTEELNPFQNIFTSKLQSFSKWKSWQDLGCNCYGFSSWCCPDIHGRALWSTPGAGGAETKVRRCANLFFFLLAKCANLTCLVPGSNCNLSFTNLPTWKEIWKWKPQRFVIWREERKPTEMTASMLLDWFSHTANLSAFWERAICM